MGEEIIPRKHNKEEEELFMACTKCREKFDDFEFDKLLFLDSCGHIVWKQCFVELIENDYVRNQKAEWPECSQQIHEFEIKAVIGEEKFEELQKKALESMMDVDQSMVKCQWGNIMSFVEGKVDYKQRDDQGKILSRKAAEHMSKYRVRWDAWANNFCTSCREQPYHIGKTCEEHKAYSESVKCRFCGKAIEGGKKEGAFKDVCESKQWKDMIKQSWDKIHKCGHPCKGFRREKKCLPCLHPDCVQENPDFTLGEDDSSFWSIWFISGIGDQPSIQLGCKHIFHVEWIAEKIRQKWSGPRITFLFKTCPSCKGEVEADHHPEISKLIEEACKMEEEIKAKALERAKIEGLDKDPRLKKKDDVYYNDLQKICYGQTILLYLLWM